MISGKRKIRLVYELLEKEFGHRECALEHENALQLLVATILSAQCTDRMVNLVTKPLFKKYTSAEEFAAAAQNELEQDIHKCGYYRAKSKNIIAACAKIVHDFHGNVPDNMEELTSLPGVGRKTANVLLGDVFQKPGMPVDTHVKRLANLIGLTKSSNPEKIEAELCAWLPPEFWSQFSHLLIALGRSRCKANRPDCANCVLNSICSYGRKHVDQV